MGVIINRRKVNLQPIIRDTFDILKEVAGAEELEVEFCDNLERGTYIRFIGKRTVMMFDMSMAESVCLFYFSKREGYLDEYVAYLFYQICSEYAFVNGKYNIAKYLSRKLEPRYKKINELFTTSKENEDVWKIALFIQYFIFIHEIGHYKYYKDSVAREAAESIRAWMLGEAEKYKDVNNPGNEQLVCVLNDELTGEELFCDVMARSVSTTAALNQGIIFDEALIADIMLSLALIAYIMEIAKVIIDGSELYFCGCKYVVNIDSFTQSLIRSFFARDYLEKFPLNNLASNYKDRAFFSEKFDIKSTYENFYKQVNSLFYSEEKELVELIVLNREEKTTREERVAIKEIISRHIPLFYMEGEEFDCTS